MWLTGTWTATQRRHRTQRHTYSEGRFLFTAHSTSWQSVPHDLPGSMRGFVSLWTNATLHTIHWFEDLRNSSSGWSARLLPTTAMFIKLFSKINWGTKKNIFDKAFSVDRNLINMLHYWINVINSLINCHMIIAWMSSPLPCATVMDRLGERTEKLFPILFSLSYFLKFKTRTNSKCLPPHSVWIS